MPNHVKNIVAISGDKESVKRFKEQVMYQVEGEDGKLPISFQTIVPMPEELNIESGSRSYIAQDYARADEQGKAAILAERKVTEEQLKPWLDNLSKYGSATWYEWRIARWGTKWDAYEQEVEDETDTMVRLTFWTAWSTPSEVMQALSAKFPTLEISVDYADEDMGSNCGSYRCEDGCIDYTETGDYEFACEVWGYVPEEEECEV